MSAPAKNVATYYQAPKIQVNAIAVHVVDLHAVPDLGVEYVTYEGEQTALQQAGIAPAAMFIALAANASGTKSARFLHTDGREEHVRLIRRAGGLWRVKRRHFMENSYAN